MATGLESRRSACVNRRPATRVTPIASKKPSDTLRTWAFDPLPDRCREALVHATFQALAGLAQDATSVVVRAEPQRGGVLVTILTVGPGITPHAADLDRARAHLAEVGGVFTVEPVPYAELWVPGAG